MSASRKLVGDFYAIGITTNTADNPVPNLPAKVDGDMSADIIGPETDASLLDNMMFQVAWTSTDAVGVLAVQVSTTAGKQWDDITFNPALTQPNSDNGQYSILLGAMPNTKVRFVYRRTSGSGRLEVRFAAKGD